GREFDGGAAGCALRRRCLRQFRPPRSVDGSGVLLADRAVRAGNPQTASRSLATALSVDSPRRARVLSEPRRPGAPRCGIQSGAHPATLRHAPPSGTCARYSEVQARRAVADERCDGAALWIIITP